MLQVGIHQHGGIARHVAEAGRHGDLLAEVAAERDRLDAAVLAHCMALSSASVASVEPSSTKITSQSRPRLSSTGRSRATSGSSPRSSLSTGTTTDSERPAAARRRSWASRPMASQGSTTLRVLSRGRGQAAPPNAVLATLRSGNAMRAGMCAAGAARRGPRVSGPPSRRNRSGAGGRPGCPRGACSCSSAPCTAAIRRLRSRWESESGSPARSRMTVPR